MKFAVADGTLVHLVDTRTRITHAPFLADGQSLIISGANGQPQRKAGDGLPWGRLQMNRIEA